MESKRQISISNPISPETPICDEEDSHLGGCIEDKNAILPIDAAIQSHLRETLIQIVDGTAETAYGGDTPNHY